MLGPASGVGRGRIRVETHPPCAPFLLHRHSCVENKAVEHTLVREPCREPRNCIVSRL